MKYISEIIFCSAVASATEWCVLRKENEILAGKENDIDLFVSAEGYGHFLSTLKMALSRHKVDIVRERAQPAGISYILFHSQNGEFQKLDVVYDTTFVFFSIFPRHMVLRNILQGKRFPVLAPRESEEISVRKELVRTNWRAYLQHEKLAAKEFHQPLLRRTILGGYLRSLFANVRRPSGCFIVLVGPDGSGKTTIAESILRAAKPYFFAQTMFHFSIPTFPRLARLRRKKTPEPDYTLPDSGSFAPIHSRMRETIYVLYYGLELLVYSHLRLKRLLRLGHLVIFDRYLHDFMYQRSHQKAPRKLLRSFLRSARRPDLVIYCKGDPAEIRKRKPELSVEEIGSQQGRIEYELLPFWRSVGQPVLTVDTTSNGITEVTETVVKHLART